ncbi:MAG: excinuclease ABC subunit UvrC, partial [Planctomycetes bacterium]|nr:excinuclease ABC subunit UvrC [Planctomycetota bacterium]
MPNQPFPPGEATGGAGSPGPLAAKLGRLPRSPGVYLFKDARGRTIYAGKAAVLAARVRGYFTRDGDGRVNLPFLMRHVADVETIVTATEKDALVLENEVIKKEKPRYNVLLKDDKHFAVIRVSVKHRFPRVSVERAFRRDGGLYFGPFTSAGAMRETLKTLGQVFPLRRCTDYELAHRERPCLYWDIGCCAAPCVGRIGEAEYRAHVEGFVATLQGKDEALPTRLRDEMEAAARDLRFEDAARRRDQLRALETVTAQHRPVAPGMEDFDAFGAHRVRTHAEFSVAQVRAGKIAWVDSYTVKSELPDDDLLASVVARYYDRRDFVPRAVLLPRDLPGAEVIAAWLAERRGGPVDLAVPQRGEKRRVLEMAEENARENYRVKIDAEQRNRALLEALRDALSLVNLPARIECVDNSNIQGTSPVAAVVAFTNGVPDKARYRKYRVKSVAGADDFATME